MTKKTTAAANMTFRQAYEVLQHHAETLRNQSEPNIDDLLTLVEESVAAYKVCQKQIAAVEKALQKALTDMDEAVDQADVDPPAPAQKKPRAAKRSPSAPSGQPMPDLLADDDVPF